MSDRIRKQVYELVEQDFQRQLIWEFCLDEEGEEGQDEATVRPSTELEVPGLSLGAFVVAADFQLADGTQFEGYLYSGPNDDLGCVQPNMFTTGGQINFWSGIGKRDPTNLYSQLGKSAAKTFPIEVKSRVKVDGRVMRVTLSGFAGLDEEHRITFYK